MHGSNLDTSHMNKPGGGFLSGGDGDAAGGGASEGTASGR